MGCGGSRVVTEFLENNKENYGKPSDLERAIQLLEEHKRSKITILEKAEYKEKGKGLNIGEAQQWIIQAKYEDGKKPNETFSVWLASNGMFEIQLGTFST